MNERPMTLAPTLVTTCKRCMESKAVAGSYITGRKYPFCCCGVVQMAKA